MNKQNRIAIIIPTKDRPEELGRLLANIEEQDCRPCQIIVVDGGEDSVNDLCRSFPALAVDYLRVIPASLTAQRNAGIRAVRDEANLIAFFDDDIVLDSGAIANMLSFWDKTDESTGGAAFNLTNEPYVKPGIFERIFMVNATMPSMVLKSGFQSKVSFRDSTVRVQWLPGCAMVWRKEVFSDHLFDEKFAGYARYEEVDFSYRVAKKHPLYIVSDARAQHLSRIEDRRFSYPLGKMEVVNRLYFVSKNPELSKQLCIWALSGIFLNNLLKGILRLDTRYLNRARGNLAGLSTVID